MTAQETLDLLLTLFPGVVASWEGPHNYYLDDDGSFRQCGFFPSSVNIFATILSDCPPSHVVVLGELVSEWMACQDTELRDVVASCFLENVAGERFSAVFRQHLS